jgi:mono/diheme cytochrome c family protein
VNPTPFVLAALVAAPGLIDGYRAAGAGAPDAARGRALWTQTFPAPDGGAARSCTSCHGPDPLGPGRHVKTGEALAAMAPAVEAKRFTDPAEVEKWFKRNCKWTLGRECTPQEKADVVLFLTEVKR